MENRKLLFTNIILLFLLITAIVVGKNMWGVNAEQTHVQNEAQILNNTETNEEKPVDEEGKQTTPTFFDDVLYIEFMKHPDTMKTNRSDLADEEETVETTTEEEPIKTEVPNQVETQEVENNLPQAPTTPSGTNIGERQEKNKTDERPPARTDDGKNNLPKTPPIPNGGDDEGKNEKPKDDKKKEETPSRNDGNGEPSNPPVNEHEPIVQEPEEQDEGEEEDEGYEDD